MQVSLMGNMMMGNMMMMMQVSLIAQCCCIRSLLQVAGFARKLAVSSTLAAAKWHWFLTGLQHTNNTRGMRELGFVMTACVHAADLL
jgi:hypothetical protein